MASLTMNPIMNVMALPFAMVVSVIAATTVFRNVFLAYDSFGNSPSNEQQGESAANIRRNSVQVGFSVGGQRITNSSRRLTRDHISMDAYKPKDTGTISSIRKVIDIDVEQIPSLAGTVG